MTAAPALLDDLETGLAVAPRLHVVGTPRRADPVAAEGAARAFLAALGIATDSESMADTPRRMADAYLEMITPEPFDLTTFPNDGGYDELVLARSIPVHSVCEHHMLPFIGIAHVGYLPGERILGLSKLARVVELFARSPQVQERLTCQVADWLEANVAPRGVGVVIEAEHLCMAVRGVRAGGARTVTSALHGVLRDDPRSRAEFLALPDGPEAAESFADPQRNRCGSRSGGVPVGLAMGPRSPAALRRCCRCPIRREPIQRRGSSDSGAERESVAEVLDDAPTRQT